MIPLTSSLVLAKERIMLEVIRTKSRGLEQPIPAMPLMVVLRSGFTALLRLLLLLLLAGSGLRSALTSFEGLPDGRWREKGGVELRRFLKAVAGVPPAWT
jgi:hypothetical protein